ncbi:hypothetical protein F5X99DRAFT_370126 [Biscogniauxia marginata]|nr:hypothetical protein F5X99DRAFT_370126 [Biscogniauxia marginata]
MAEASRVHRDKTIASITEVGDTIVEVGDRIVEVGGRVVKVGGEILEAWRGRQGGGDGLGAVQSSPLPPPPPSTPVSVSVSVPIPARLVPPANSLASSSHTLVDEDQIPELRLPPPIEGLPALPQRDGYFDGYDVGAAWGHGGDASSSIPSTPSLSQSSTLVASDEEEDYYDEDEEEDIDDGEEWVDDGSEDTDTGSDGSEYTIEFVLRDEDVFPSLPQPRIVILGEHYGFEDDLDIWDDDFWARLGIRRN